MCSWSRSHSSLQLWVRGVIDSALSIYTKSQKAKSPISGQTGCEAFSCPLCGAIFLDPNDVGHHLETSHPDQALFRCNTCGKAFKSRKSLKQHRSLKHREEMTPYEIIQSSLNTPPRTECSSNTAGGEIKKRELC